MKLVKLRVKWSHLAENDVSRGQIGSKFGQVGEKIRVRVRVDRRAVGDGRRTGGLRHGAGGADQNSGQVQSAAQVHPEEAGSGTEETRQTSAQTQTETCAVEQVPT